MKLEYPLNDALPVIEHTRDRLLAKIFDFRKNGDPDDVATDEDYELLYAYGKFRIYRIDRGALANLMFAQCWSPVRLRRTLRPWDKTSSSCMVC